MDGFAPLQLPGLPAGASSAAPAAPRRAAPVLLDTANVQREVWLVKVPEVLASVVRQACSGGSESGSGLAAAAASGSVAARPIGKVVEMPASGLGSSRPGAPVARSSAAVGSKRGRQQLRLQLDGDRLIALFGPAVAKRVPRTYTLNLDAPTGTRLLHVTESGGASASSSDGSASHSSGSGAATGGAGASAAGSSAAAAAAASASHPVAASFFGTASAQGAALPDLRDPHYSAYSAWKKSEGDRIARETKRSTTLVEDGDALTAIDFANRRAEMEAAAAREAREAAADAAGAALDAASAIAPASSIFEMFERQAYWSVKDMAIATGAREGELRELVRSHCEYVKSGPHRGTYKLRPQFRTVASVAPEDNDGIPQ